MPAILPFIPLIVAGASLAGTGVAAYDANNASIDQGAAQAANQKALLAQQQAQATQANLTKQEAVLGAQGQTQDQTGGSLTDSGTTSFTDLLAGYPGYQSGGSTGTGTGSNGAGTPSSAISPTALSGGANPGGTGTPDIASILALLRGGSGGSGFGGSGSNLSGGNWQSTPAQPSINFELANPQV